jgi:iron complex outermembrane recepter protein
LYEYDPDGLQGYTNASGGARIFGAELALTARPVQSLTLSGAFALLDARLRQAEPALGAAANERLPNTGPYTANLSGDYVFTQGGLRPTFGANLRMVPNRKAGFDGGESVGTPQYDLPAYAALDLHAGLLFGKLETQLYVRNLFDTRGQLSAFTYTVPLGGPVWVSLIQPRTIGLTASIHF